MPDSPRTRRLRSDQRALETLRRDSTIFDFEVRDPRSESYAVHFSGKGFYRPAGSESVLILERHEVEIQLGAGYPRVLPGLSWGTPVFHPNISAGGVVCLGGYGTHWVPSLNLAELCEMLWEMIRYRNYDIESPYNREAALWAQQQQHYPLPIDPRPIRDKIAAASRSSDDPDGAGPPSSRPSRSNDSSALSGQLSSEHEPSNRDASDVIEAEVVDGEDQDILFLD